MSLILAIFLICNIGNKYRLSKSFERYKYKRELEVLNNKLKIITNANKDGILIIDRNDNIICNNLNFLGLLRCPYEQIMTNISSMKYCPGKKLSGFGVGDSLIDDLHNMINIEENKEITLGVTQLEDLNLV